ncbi:zincin, partial [Martensiomyces pterosporus]
MLSNPYSRAPGTRYATSIIYRQSDLINDGGEHSTHRFHRRSAESSVDSRTTCGAHRLANNAPEKLLALGPGDAFYPHRTPADSFRSLRDRGFGLLTKRTNATTNFDQSQAAIKAGCIQARKIVYMGAAADCSYVTQYQSQDKARQQILSDWNQASAVYERQLNVALGLIELQVEDMSCPANVDSSKAWNRGCSESYNIQNRLSDFSTWRGKKGDDGCGLWHLMTNCPTGTEVGLAWLKTLCMTTSSPNTYQGGISSGTGVSAVSRDEWKVVAHEIGHNFGASHDCTSQDCPACANGCDQCCPCTDNCDCKGKYIMNPTSPVSSDDFSPCSIKNMCATISGAVSKCLQDPGKRNTLSTAMCGNGIKETGEECDCGTSEQCKNDPCCDSSTCKLKPGAQCADVNDLCCSQCKLKSNGSVCRPKYSECDIEETCDGQSSDCPSDKHVSDGTSCGNSTAGLKCASGQCTSRDAQCVARGGPDGLTQHCPISMGGDLCDLQCSKPGNPTMCTFMSGSFIDGTDCGFHARCRGGTCKGDNWFYQFLLIFQRNLAISIPIAVAVGLIIL